MRKKDFKRIMQSCGNTFYRDGSTTLNCLYCGHKLKFSGTKVKCDNGHKFSYIGYSIDYIRLFQPLKHDYKMGNLVHITDCEDMELPKILEVCDVR